MVKYKNNMIPYIYMEFNNGHKSIMLLLDNKTTVFDHNLKNFIVNYNNTDYNLSLTNKNLSDAIVSFSGTVPKSSIKENIRRNIKWLTNNIHSNIHIVNQLHNSCLIEKVIRQLPLDVKVVKYYNPNTLSFQTIYSRKLITQFMSKHFFIKKYPITIINISSFVSTSMVILTKTTGNIHYNTQNYRNYKINTLSGDYILKVKMCPIKFNNIDYHLYYPVKSITYKTPFEPYFILEQNSLESFIKVSGDLNPIIEYGEGSHHLITVLPLICEDVFKFNGKIGEINPNFKLYKISKLWINNTQSKSDIDKDFLRIYNEYN